MTSLPNPFTDSGAHTVCTPDEAVASFRQMSDAAAAIPADEQRHPFGCPDAEWCRGNRLCYWHCNADPDDISNIGEIFAGARKLFDPDPAGYTSADQAYYDLLLQLDDPHTADLIDIPEGMWMEFDPAPLFLRQVG